jgi:hypothetical protein
LQLSRKEQPRTPESGTWAERVGIPRS